jgi:hypothetical protein
LVRRCPSADGKSSILELRRASTSLRQLERHGHHHQLLRPEQLPRIRHYSASGEG